MITFLIATIIGIILYLVFPETPVISAVYAAFAPIFIIAYLWNKRKSRCENPKCRKHYAYVEIDRSIVSTRESSERVAKEWWNPRTEMYETYWDSVPATVIKYGIVEECKYCGHRRYRTETEKISS